MHDNSVQDTELKRRVDKFELQAWFEKCMAEAKLMVEEEAEARREEERVVREVKGAMDGKREGVRALENRAVNGDGDGFEEDEDGDEHDAIAGDREHEAREGDSFEDEDGEYEHDMSNGDEDTDMHGNGHRGGDDGDGDGDGDVDMS